MNQRTGRLFLALMPVLAAPLMVLAAAPATAAASTGWVRLAHLSPDTPSVDVYLYPFGNPQADITLKHVGYGAVSPYQSVAAGRYTVAMRGAGADPASPPVISTNLQVSGGAAVTVAGLGRTASLTIEVLKDSLSAPAGTATVRLIEASLRVPVVHASLDGESLANELHFPDVTAYSPVEPGRGTVRATGTGGDASLSVQLSARSTHTIVVLDGPSSGIRLMELTDASGSASTPVGSVNTGLGGTAPNAADAGWRARVGWIALAVAALGFIALTWRARPSTAERA
ncbi:MAG TPA: DUF4397 domain-containing protein [Actinomycetes bacterium]